MLHCCVNLDALNLSATFLGTCMMLDVYQIALSVCIDQLISFQLVKYIRVSFENTSPFPA